MPLFGDPIAVETLPERSTKGGRNPIRPEVEAFFKRLDLTKAATYEVPGTDPNKEGHPVGRIATFKEVAKATPGTSVETRAIETGKRYRVFVTVAPPSANGDAKASTKATAPKA